MNKRVEQRALLTEASALVVRALREGVVIEFLDGQKIRLVNLTWSLEADGVVEFIGIVADRLPKKEALRFFVSEIASVSNPDTGEVILRLPSHLL